METATPFSEFELNSSLVSALSSLGLEKASPIQEITIGPILKGQDIFAQAETGSGKTAAFAVPLIEKLLRRQEKENLENSKETKKLVQYIILSPTRELAQQTHKVFNQLGKNLGINAACLIGGESIDKQKEILHEGTRILVATPGRLMDLIRQKAVKLDQVKGVVFDEADRLFDMGFQKDIEFILGKIDDHRQLIMVSATSNLEVLKTAYKFKSHPLELKLNEDSLVVDHIDHKVAMITGNEKMPFLVNTLHKHEDVYAIIFCNTQIQTHLVAEWLRLMHFKAKPISGRLPQNKRTRLMEEFRNKKVTILVCTDVAARGLDIKDVNLVINYDLPHEAANYVHRIGRTGRAGAKGKAISFCAHEDCENLDAIIEFLETKIEKLPVADEDVRADIPPRPYIDAKTLKISDRPGHSASSHQQRDRNKGKKRNVETKREYDQTEDKTPLERAFPTPPKKFFPSEEKRRDRRSFVVTTDSLEDAQRMALGYFMITDKSLLKREIIKKGAKRFFFFGPRKNSYRYTLDSHFKKLILPFLIEILTLSHMDVMVKVSYRGDSLDITFNGPDEALLIKNRGEMLNGIEQLLRLYLANKITIPPKLRWNLSTKSFRKEHSKSGRDSQRRQPRRGEQRNPSQRRFSRSRREENEKRDSEILKLAQDIKEKVLKSKDPQTIRPLNPRDRRTIHQYFNEQENFKTTSIGDGRLKKIEVSLLLNELS